MRTIKCPLIDGLKVGEKIHKKAVLRVLTVGEIIAASEAAERSVLCGDHYELLASPTLMGIETLCRRVVSIGAFQGPLTMNEIEKLSETDMAILQDKADELDKAIEINLKKTDDNCSA